MQQISNGTSQLTGLSKQASFTIDQPSSQLCQIKAIVGHLGLNSYCSEMQ